MSTAKIPGDFVTLEYRRARRSARKFENDAGGLLRESFAGLTRSVSPVMSDSSTTGPPSIASISQRTRASSNMKSKSNEVSWAPSSSRHSLNDVMADLISFRKCLTKYAWALYPLARLWNSSVMEPVTSSQNTRRQVSSGGSAKNSQSHPNSNLDPLSTVLRRDFRTLPFRIHSTGTRKDVDDFG